MEGLYGDNGVLYSKCLFKTISFEDLKTELLKKGFEIRSESYYELTMRLRLLILEEESCYEDIQEQLKAEIAVILKKPERGYTCSLSGCSYTSSNYKKLVNHIKTLHGSSNQHFVCQLNGCTRVLSSVKMLCVHIKTSHQKRKSTVVLKQNQLAEQLSRLRCLSSACSHQCVKTVKDLKVHIVRAHTDKMQEVECIFAGCNFKANVTGTMRSHFSRKHPLNQIHNLKTEILTQVEDLDKDIEVSRVVESTDTFELEDISDFVDDMDLSNFGVGNDADDEVENQVVFTRALAMTFNMWMNVKNIAYSTVNLIVAEVFNSYEQGVNLTKGKISRLLQGDGMSADEISRILAAIDTEDPFVAARRDLEREVDRKKYIVKEFDNVQPVTVRLNNENRLEKPDTMQYVPIKKSLKLLLEDETFIKQKESDPYYPEENVIKDCKDGAYLKENQFFKDNPEAVPLLIFQDELEVLIIYMNT